MASDGFTYARHVTVPTLYHMRVTIPDQVADNAALWRHTQRSFPVVWPPCPGLEGVLHSAEPLSVRLDIPGAPRAGHPPLYSRLADAIVGPLPFRPLPTESAATFYTFYWQVGMRDVRGRLYIIPDQVAERPQRFGFHEFTVIEAATGVRCRRVIRRLDQELGTLLEDKNSRDYRRRGR